MAISTSTSFVWNGANLAAQLEAAIEQGMEEQAEAMKQAAQGFAPVRTGALRDSITATVESIPNGARIVLAAGVPYAIFVEQGTSRMSAQPFIRPAVDQEGPRLGERIRAAVASIR